MYKKLYRKSWYIKKYMMYSEILEQFYFEKFNPDKNIGHRIINNLFNSADSIDHRFSPWLWERNFFGGSALGTQLFWFTFLSIVFCRRTNNCCYCCIYFILLLLFIFFFLSFLFLFSIINISIFFSFYFLYIFFTVVVSAVTFLTVLLIQLLSCDISPIHMWFTVNLIV